MEIKRTNLAPSLKRIKGTFYFALIAGAVALTLVAATGCGSGGGSSNGGPGGTPLNLTGDWNFHFTITHAEGPCAGDIGSESNETIHIIHTGGLVSLSGFVGLDTNVLNGTILDGDIEFSGVNQEDGGETTTSYTGVVADENTMGLTEQWSWTNGVNTCPNGTASVTATRIL